MRGGEEEWDQNEQASVSEWEWVGVLVSVSEWVSQCEWVNEGACVYEWKLEWVRASERKWVSKQRSEWVSKQKSE